MNERLMSALKRCPICGGVPKILDCYDVDKRNYVSYERHCYKLCCSNSSFHVSCGDWYDSKYQACKDWNRRTEDNTQPEFWKKRRKMTVSDALKIVAECGLNIEETVHDEVMVQIKSALEKQIRSYKWLKNQRVESENYGKHYCGCCGQYAKEFDCLGEFLPDYCYYCGSRMEGEENA